MNARKPGLGDFRYIIAARAAASLIVALGVIMAMLLILMTFYAQAILGLLIFLIGAFWAQLLVRDLEQGNVLLPFGYVNRSRNAAAFWFFFCLFCILIPLLLTATAWYLVGF